MSVLFEDKKIEVAVIILTYNCKDLSKDLTPIIQANTEVDETVKIVFADNASTDGTPEFLASEFPEIPLLKFNENYGFSEGYNQAIKRINCDYAVLLSCDVEVAPNWLPPLLTLMKSDNEIGALQPKIKSYHKRTHFEYAGASGGYLDVLGFPFCRGRVFKDTEEDKGQYNDTKEVFWSGGCCFMVKRKVYIELGGLDPDFFAHMEEIDLCWRYQKNGYKVMVEPSSEVYHMGGFKLNYNNPFKLYLNSRNNLSMLTKNLTTKNLLWCLPLRLFIDCMAVVYLTFTDGFQQGKAVVKGDFHFLKSFGKWWKKRDGKEKAFKELNGIYSGFIFMDYFVAGKKKFSQIIKR